VNLLDWAGLAATTAGAALLYTLTGFGFALLRRRSFCCSSTRRGRRLIIIISTALSFVALPGLWRAIAPGLLLRLGSAVWPAFRSASSLSGMPIRSSSAY
jgi:hypothetical protein